MTDSGVVTVDSNRFEMDFHPTEEEGRKVYYLRYVQIRVNEGLQRRKS